MSEFTSRVMERLPRSWLGRAFWILLTLSAFVLAMGTGYSYAECRLDGTGAIACFAVSLFGAYLGALIIVTAIGLKLLSIPLP